MNKQQALVLLVYGVLLLILAFGARVIEPHSATLFWLTLAGGGLCVTWGALGQQGFRRRLGPMLTFIALIFVLLSQSVSRWMSLGDSSTSLPLTVVITAFLLLTIGLWIWIMPHEEGIAGKAVPNGRRHG